MDTPHDTGWKDALRRRRPAGAAMKEPLSRVYLDD